VLLISDDSAHPFDRCRFHWSRLPAFLCILLALYPSTTSGQVGASKYEVRAAWVATAAGLDWPESYDVFEQKESLRRIVRLLKLHRFNTILFQVRARGDAYYASTLEPWAENLTGTLGKDPGWDPLAFLLKEAQDAGMEVHAWFNVYKVRGPSPVGSSSPPHPVKRFPQWTYEVDGEAWLDPGVPEVRSYLVRVAMELVRRYEIDGIHFDFIRYPGKVFPDGTSHRRYGSGVERDEWRRRNIDQFVGEFYSNAMLTNPMLKVGSAPLGVFSGGTAPNGWGAYHAYYQDSRRWLREGNHDYLVPQIYWDFGESKDDPDFARLARSWRKEGFGRHVWAGIGAYKPEVFDELEQQIDTARTVGMDGQAFFRFAHIKNGIPGSRYATLALIPPMPWKDPVPPLPPDALAVSPLSSRAFHLEWLPPDAGTDGDLPQWYSIYRSTTGMFDMTSVGQLVDVIPSSSTFYLDTVRDGAAYKYFYAVASIDKGNNESPRSNIAAVTVKEVASLRGRLAEFTNLSISVPRERTSPTLVAYTVASRSQVSVEILRTPDDAPVVSLVRQEQGAGTYIAGLSPGRLPPGVYVVRLVAGNARLDQLLDLR
jgi:uncharacterized lipoprotein YddW (UPF0748 family)